ncbi:DEAD/DEAH box helicase [Williamsia muralis]|uniref:SNF2-related protein n=1 Tax=Williamsia marianensis TaxID=85044 RepID=A0ABU4ETH8_WILMA|nr:SNF2-related protein [Williamsia muralis]MDV7134560.1 SNF2-related protein [Williamsia muralis]
MTTEWAHTITPDALKGDFDAGAIQRGSAYARQRRVAAVQWDDDKRRLTGRCQGTGVATYSVRVVFSHLGPGWKLADAGCTCPVGYFCKHAVALLLTFADEAATSATPPIQRSPQWERTLQVLYSENHPKPPEKLALQAFLSAPSLFASRARRAQLALRPMRPGTRSAWIKSGVDWPAIVDLKPGTFAAQQLSVLQSMARDSMRTTPYGLPHGLILADAPATVWQQLDAAAAAGIPLLGDPASGINTVQVAKRAGLTVSVSGEVGADAHVSVEVTIDGNVVPTSEVTILGKGDPHGIGYLDAHGVLTLAPFDSADAPAAALLQGDQPIVIPAADVSRFADVVLPRLRESVPIRVDDSVFVAPTISGPTPVMAVRFTGDVAHTHWAMRYLVNSTPRDLDDAIGTQPSWRDRVVEEQIWESIRDALAAVALTSGAAGRRLIAAFDAQQGSGRVRQTDEVGPADYEEAVNGVTTHFLRHDVHLNPLETARLCAEVLPALAGRDDLIVEVAEVAQRYRQVTERAQLRIAGSQSADTDWLDLDITMDVDGEQIPIAEVLAELSTGATHMLLPSGVYFPLDSPELVKLRQLMDEAEVLGEAESGRVPAVPTNVTLWEELLELGVVDEQLQAWQERIAKLSAARPPEAVQPPAMLHATLRDYQLDGLNWLSFLWDNGFGGVLADDMGLGKTLQTLALFGRARENGETGRFLVVAPTSVVNNWASECHRFTDLRAVTITATQARGRTPLAEIIADADVVITTYALLRIDFPAYDEQHWAALVLDEAQFVKNRNSKAHLCARRLKTPFKLAITGTPMENNLMELWSLLSITVPGLFPDPKAFADYFRKPIEKGEDPERLSVLRKRIKPVMLRRTKDQVARDLPAKQEQILHVELSARHRKIYDTRLVREREIVLGLLGDLEKNRFQIFRSLTMLRQLSLHAGLVDPADAEVASAKVDFIREQLPELIAEGHSALIFSSFTGFLDVLRRGLDGDGITYSYLDGSLSSRERAEAVSAFTEGTTQVFLISLKAGGFGLNLTEADYCFVCDPWWNPAAEAQAVDRTHRIGQTRPVTVYRLVSADTIEAKVVALQNRKRELFSAVVDDGNMFSSTVSADDIRHMLD